MWWSSNLTAPQHFPTPNSNSFPSISHRALGCSNCLVQSFAFFPTLPSIRMKSNLRFLANPTKSLSKTRVSKTTTAYLNQQARQSNRAAIFFYVVDFRGTTPLRVQFPYPNSFPYSDVQLHSIFQNTQTHFLRFCTELWTAEFFDSSLQHYKLFRECSKVVI